MNYKSYAVSDIGNVKEINQDAYILMRASFDSEPMIFAAVADGMGGTTEGEIASKTVKDSFSSWFNDELGDMLNEYETDFDEYLKSKDRPDRFGEALAKRWNEIIFSASDYLTKTYGEGTAPGTTLTQIFLYKGIFYAVNIGDSRIYKYEKGELYQVTQDHSWEFEALQMGMSPEEITSDRRRNSITRCIGVSSDFNRPDFFVEEFAPGDKFLLCSDGLRHTITVKEFTKEMQKDKNSKQKAEFLVSLAKKRGEEDNITAIVIEATV